MESRSSTLSENMSAHQASFASSIWQCILFKYNRIEESSSKEVCQFHVCTQLPLLLHGNDVAGDYDDDNGNNYSIILYFTLYFIHYDSAPIYVESIQQHNICVLHITTESAFHCCCCCFCSFVQHRQSIMNIRIHITIHVHV